MLTTRLYDEYGKTRYYSVFKDNKPIPYEIRKKSGRWYIALGFITTSVISIGYPTKKDAIHHLENRFVFDKIVAGGKNEI